LTQSKQRCKVIFLTKTVDVKILAYRLNGRCSVESFNDELLRIESLKLQVRDSEPSDPYRMKTVQLLDDFRVASVNGNRILIGCY